MLTVCVSASSTIGLAKTCELRDELGTSATSDDARMNRHILQATAWAEGIAGRPLRAQVYSESLAAYGRPTLKLSRYPVIAILRVFDTTATCAATQYTSTEYRLENAEAGILNRDEGFEWTNYHRHGEGTFNLGLTPAILPGWEAESWLVEYVAGYIYPGVSTDDGVYTTEGGSTSTESTLPDDLGAAILLKAKQYYEGGGDVKSREVGDLKVTYVDRRNSEANELLEPYRSIQ